MSQKPSHSSTVSEQYQQPLLQVQALPSGPVINRKTYREQYLDEMQIRVNNAVEKYIRRHRRKRKEKSELPTAMKHSAPLNQSQAPASLPQPSYNP